ncbi:immunity protein Imm33 domain-containing protein [Flavobacterium lindanitolerans]|uniref:immunity protein Imm33 domain-containing protein n=1 Tax=Flavobacterium lindanitolerans TaxID=428988 RepID=UPI003FA1B2CB
MSGWYLTTNLYNDDINSLKQIGLPDLARRRTELIKYLALDSSFRFFSDSKNDEVWFDEEVLD